MSESQGKPSLISTPKSRLCLKSACIALLAVILTLIAPESSALSTLVINGVEGELAENIRLQISQPPEQEENRAFNRYVEGLPDKVVTVMSAYGYYSATATISVDKVAPPKPKSRVQQTLDYIGGSFPGKRYKPDQTPATHTETTANADSTQIQSPITQVTVSVTANAPVRITKLQLLMEDETGSNTDFDEVLGEVRKQLPVGKIFVSDDYEAAKSALLSTAQNMGYFNFEFKTAQVKVSRRASSADIQLLASAGKRYTFGEILFKQHTFSDAFMHRWVPFKTGDPYQASLIGELTQSLQSSGYFSSVRVRPLLDPRYEQVVPITVDLTQRDLNQVAVGVGYSTNTEMRTKLTWGKPILNLLGHSAEWHVSLSKDTQSASFAYRIPRDKQPQYNYWGVEYGLKNDDNGDVNSFLSTLNFQRVSRTARDWTESLFIRWERERFKSGSDEEQTTDLVLPGVSYNRSRSKGEPFATWGQSLSFQLMGGSKRALSTIDFLKAHGRFRYLKAVSDRNTLIGTVQYGAIHANDLDRVPTSQRFFAGGDRTIRGFGYRNVSPRECKEVEIEGNTELECEAVGGRFLEIINLEYNYRIHDRWSIALFTDAGRAFDNFSSSYSVGTGFGVRWQSPVGPFRIDIATPISDDISGNFRIHLSLGPDL